MAERIFTINELAELCNVHRETIRRWKDEGYKGQKLQSYNNDSGVKGKPILFTTSAIREFAKYCPKFMTAKLKEILDETAIEEPTPQGAVFSVNVNDGDFLKRLLLEKKASLLKELEQTEATLRNLEKGE